MLSTVTVRATENRLPSGNAAAWSAMRHLGCPFAQSLAAAWELGSVEQKSRIDGAFADLLAHYAEIAPDALIEVQL
jgi:hypothetical protein